jgi:uncharacterized protein YoxC
MTVIEISVGIIALSFVFLVFYLIRTLLSVQGSLKLLGSTMVHMQQQIDELNRETVNLIRNTNQITLDVQKKSKSLDALFHSVENAGLAVEQVTESVREVSSTFAQNMKQKVTSVDLKQDKLSEVIRLTTIGIGLWKKWQALKPEPKHKQEYVAKDGQKASV